LIAFFVRIFGVFSSWKPSAGLLNFNRQISHRPSLNCVLFYFFSIFLFLGFDE
jgi:hypothetical protein